MAGAGQLAGEELETGSVIAGRFRVQQRLGRGGMGTVYRVREERSGTQLALKRHVLNAGDEARRGMLATQFEREYHSLAELQHPRIIEVYDYGVDAGTPFYTMELLDGEDLQARKQRPWLECCMLLDVASSLATLHSRRLLHRHLSPRNVRCTSDGRAKLIDFGAMAPMGAAKTLAGTPMFVPGDRHGRRRRARLPGRPATRRAGDGRARARAHRAARSRRPHASASA
jgi:serine/threonine protein kinase